MAERRPLPVPEQTPESSSSPLAKRSRIEEAEFSSSSTSSPKTIPERTIVIGLETTETLAPPSEISPSSEEEKIAPKIMVESSRVSGPAESRDEFSSAPRHLSDDREDIDEELDNSTRSLSRRMTMERRESAGPSDREKSSLVGEHARYEEISLIGDGAYGTVYKAKDLTSGHVVALKKVRVPLTEDGLPSSTLREIAGLKQLERFEHPHIVKLLDVCQGNYLQLPAADELSGRIDRGLTLWLVFEHVERDLASFIASRENTRIEPPLARQMSREIILGVDFLHSHRIVHRDLKPQNLLVTRDGHIKIADFGLAKTYDFEMRLTSVVVTLWYRAPEVLLGCPYATPVDLWSVGCILAEINRLQPIFPGTSEGDQLDRIFQIIGTPSQENWPENVSISWTAFPHRRPKALESLIPSLDQQGLDLIKNLLTFDPHIRLSAAQALTHRYFADMES